MFHIKGRIIGLFTYILIAIAILFVSISPCLAESYTIGSKGDMVKDIQGQLNILGYEAGTADGSFGNKTAAAVKSFQTRNGLKRTGIADEETIDLMFSKDAKTALAQPEVFMSNVNWNSNTSRIEGTLVNKSNTDIISHSCAVITFGINDKVVTNQDIDKDENLMVSTWGSSTTIKSGSQISFYLDCPYGGWVKSCAVGVAYYVTSDGKITSYDHEDIIYTCSDGSIIYPENTSYPFVYYSSDDFNEIYHTDFDPDVLNVVYGYNSFHITRWLGECYNLPEGQYVVDSIHDSYMYNAGIRSGDVITLINGIDPRDEVLLMSTKEKFLAGEIINVEYYRNGNYYQTSMNISTDDDSSGDTDTEVSLADELAKLADLFDKGLLTEEEFEAAKAKLLNN